MSSENNFRCAVNSGAKGQYFNITQITGLFRTTGSACERIKKTLNNESRTLPHYPCDKNLYTDEMKYESRGFIFSSFYKA